MANIYAETPKNCLGVRIPLARHGATQLPIPQPATVGEANSYEFGKKLEAVVRAQNEANAVAAQAEREKEFSKPYVAPGSARTSSADRPTPVASSEQAAGAAAAREALQLPSVSAVDQMRERHALAASEPTPAASRATPELTQDEFARGAAAAREALQAAGAGPSLADHIRARHGVEPGASAPAADNIADRMRARHGIAASDEQRGAAEAIALLKIAGR